MIEGKFETLSVEKDIFIALGSNIGDREKNLLRGISEVAGLPASRVATLSSFYDTEPVGMASAMNFLNAVLQLESSLPPEELLRVLMLIEKDVFNRERRGGVESRKMDLDILFYGKLVIDKPPELVIPHPRLHLRQFVLEPLAEIAPEFKHPVHGRSVSQLLTELGDMKQLMAI